MMIRSVAISLLLACGQGLEPDSGGEETMFVAAVLDPPFEHANAIWAGTALFDADGDGLTDIFFTNGENAPDALYLNRGDGTFEEAAAAAGLDSLAESGGVASGDLDNDGDADLVVSVECSTGSFASNGAPLNDGDIIVYLNDGTGVFEPSTPDPDLTGQSVHQEIGGEMVHPINWCTTSLVLADVDLDGILDMVVSNTFDPDLVAPWVLEKTERNARDFVLFGDGTGAFPEIAIEALPNKDTATTKYKATFTHAVFDVDGDGVPEVVAGHGGDLIKAMNVSADGLSLVDLDIGTYFPRSGVGLWMGFAVADFDGDGTIDLYGTNEGPSPMLVGYENTYGTEIAELNDFHLGHSVLTWAGESFVVDGDWTLDASHVLAGDLLEDAITLDSEMVNPVELNRLAWGWGAVALDANADGWPDVAFTGNACLAPLSICSTEEKGAGPGALLLNDGAKGFVDVTWDWGVANIEADGDYADGRGIATGDLNQDGYADIVVANRSYNPTLSAPLAQVLGSPQVLLSQPREGHWLQIDFVGTDSNRDGLGAVVTIEGDSGTRTAIFGAGGGTNSSSERILTLGLGDDESVDLTVRFPSGVEVHETGVAADQRLLIEEGS